MNHPYFYYLLLSSLLLSLSLGSLLGQSSPFPFAEKLDTYLDKELTKFQIPNLEVLLINPEGIVYARSFGEQGGIDTPYYIGSVSKSLTAMGIMSLRDQGHVALDDSVQKLLPGISFTGSTQPVLLRHLLTHTSGISKREGFRSLPSLTELQEAPIYIELAKSAGMQHEYSNLNYALLGLILEAKSGLPYAQYMQQTIFDPLGMEHSYATPLIGQEEALLQQYQYYFGYPVQSKQSNFAASVVPAGFVRSSARDLGRYIQSHMMGQNQKGDSMLSSQARQFMHTPWDGSDYGYGMGWKKGSMNEKAFLQHLGSTATSYSGIFLIPEDSLGIVFLTNSNSSSFSEEVLTGVLHIATGGEGYSCSQKEKYMGWGIGIWLLYVLVQFVLKSRKAFQGKIAGSKAQKIRNLGLSLVAILAFFFAFPFVANIPFGAFLQMRPDFGLAILASGGLSLLLALIQLLTHKDEGK